MGTELNGSRQVMCNLSANGHHMIKPMLFATPGKFNNNFLIIKKTGH